MFPYFQILLYARSWTMIYTSAKKVEYDGTETTLTLNTEYRKRGNLFWELIIYPTITPSFYRDREDISAEEYQSTYIFEYTAGYGDSTETLPPVIKIALLKQILIWYNNRENHAAILDNGIKEMLLPYSRKAEL